jgi:hypothetical protein
MEGFQQGSTYKNPVDPNDKDVRSTSRSQLTSIPSAHGASGPTSKTKKKTAVSGADGAMIVEVLENHGVGLEELDTWLTRGVAFRKVLEGLVDQGRIEKAVGAGLFLKYHGKRASNKAPKVVPCNSLLAGSVTASSLVSKSSAEARVKDHELPMAEQAGLQPLGFFYWCEGQYWYCAAGIQVQPLAGVQACL